MYYRTKQNNNPNSLPSFLKASIEKFKQIFTRPIVLIKKTDTKILVKIQGKNLTKIKVLIYSLLDASKYY